MKVAFIAVDFRCHDDTVEYALSFEKCVSAQETDGVFVAVENTGESDEVQALTDALGAVEGAHVAVNEHPKGYLNGINVGVRFAKERFDPDFYVVGNNDLGVENPDFCRMLCSLHIPDDVFIVAPQIVTESGDFQNPCLTRPHTPLENRFFDFYYSTYGVFKAMRALENMTFALIRMFRPLKQHKQATRGYIYAAHGAVFILTRRCVEAIPAFWDEIALFGEEESIAETVHRLGGRVFFEPALRLRHKVSRSLRKVPSRRLYLYVKTARDRLKEWRKGLERSGSYD